MHNLEDFKVLFISLGAIAVSYINSPLDGMRWVVLIFTLLYTIRRWYLMEKNKNK